jgi:hypothetical protein
MGCGLGGNVEQDMGNKSENVNGAVADRGAIMDVGYGTGEVLFESCFSVSYDRVVELGEDYALTAEEDLVIRVSGIKVSSLPVKVIYGLEEENAFEGLSDTPTIENNKIKKDYTVGKNLLSDRVEGKDLAFKEELKTSVEKDSNEIGESNGSPWETFFGFKLEILGLGSNKDSVASGIQGNVEREILEKASDAIGISIIDSEESQRELFLAGYVVSRHGEILGKVEDLGEDNEERGNLVLQVFGLTGSPMGYDVAHLSEEYLRRVLEDFMKRYAEVLSRMGYSKKTIKSSKSDRSYSSNDSIEFNESKTITTELKQCSEYSVWRKI